MTTQWSGSPGTIASRTVTGGALSREGIYPTPSTGMIQLREMPTQFPGKAGITLASAAVGKVTSTLNRIEAELLSLIDREEAVSKVA